MKAFAVGVLACLLSSSLAVAEEGPPVAVRSCVFRADIHGRFATTTIEQVFVNYTDRQQEIVQYWRAGPAAAVGELAMWVGGLRMPAELHLRSSAAEIYREIVEGKRDPALLEYLGDGQWRLRVFPIPAGGTQKVEMVVCHLLAAGEDGGLIYSTPRVDGGGASDAQEAELRAEIAAPGGIKDVRAGPTGLGVQRRADGSITAGVRVEAADLSQPLSVTVTPGKPVAPVAVARLTGPAGPPMFAPVFVAEVAIPEALTAKARAGRTVVIVIDRSESMKGKPFSIAYAAAKQVLGWLTPADRLNVIAVGSDVQVWKAKPVAADKKAVAAAEEFIAAPCEGGSDITAALKAAGEMVSADAKRPGIIAVFSDGAETVATAERADESGSATRPARPAGLPANARLMWLDVGPGARSGPMIRWSDDLWMLAGTEDEAAEALAGWREAMARPPVTDLAVSILSGSGVAAVSAVTDGDRRIILAGVAHETPTAMGRSAGGNARLKLTAKVAGMPAEATVDLHIPAPADAPAAGDTAVVKIWASLRAEQLHADLARPGAKPEDLKNLVEFSKTYGVSTRATAFLVLESDKEFRDRGIDRAVTQLPSNSSLAPAEATLADWRKVLTDAEEGPVLEETKKLMAQARELLRLKHYARAADVLARAAEESGHPAIRREAALLNEFAAIRQAAAEAGEDAAADSGDWYSALMPHGPIDLPPLGRAILVSRAKLEDMLPPGDAAVLKKLDAKLPKIEFSAIPLSDVINFIRDVSNLNIHVKWEAIRAATIDQRSPVTVDIRGATIAKVLRVILDDVGGVNPLDYTVGEGVVTISTTDDLSRFTVTRTYDCRDLIAAVAATAGGDEDDGDRRFGGSGLFGGGGLFGGEQSVGEAVGGGADTWGGPPAMTRTILVRQVRDLILVSPTWGGGMVSDPFVRLIASGRGGHTTAARKLVGLILENVAPDTWREGMGAGMIGSIRELGGVLVVTQTPGNHMEVARLLAELRAKLAGGGPGGFRRPGAEDMFTPDGRIAAWVGALLRLAREEKLSAWSSVRTKTVGGRKLARIGGVWFDAGLVGGEKIVPIAPGTAAAEAALPAELAKGLDLPRWTILSAAGGFAVIFDPAGAGETNDPKLAPLVEAVRRKQ